MVVAFDTLLVRFVTTWTAVHSDVEVNFQFWVHNNTKYCGQKSYTVFCRKRRHIPTVWLFFEHWQQFLSTGTNLFLEILPLDLCLWTRRSGNWQIETIDGLKGSTTRNRLSALFWIGCSHNESASFGSFVEVIYTRIWSQFSILTPENCINVKRPWMFRWSSFKTPPESIAMDCTLKRVFRWVLTRSRLSSKNSVRFLQAERKSSLVSGDGETIEWAAPLVFEFK